MEMQHVLKAAASGCLCVCISAHAVSLASSNFDSDAEGWTAVNGATDPAFVASGGAPGGYIEAADRNSAISIWAWSAPAAYLGDISAALGGTLAFSLKTNQIGPGQTDNLPDVKFIGVNEVRLVVDFGPTPLDDWTSFSLALQPGAWRLDSLTGALATEADFAGVFADVAALYIRGEFAAVARDSSALDSVSLSGPVPEPASWALWAAGLAGLGGLSRTRHR